MTDGGPGGDLEIVLRAWLSDVSAPGYWLHYHIGDAFYGETDARLHADGSYVLWSTVTSGRQRREFTGRADPADVHALADLMASEEVWRVAHVAERPAEDDSEASLEAGDGARQGRVVLWVSEIVSVPRFARVQDALLRLIGVLSDGVILEVGR